MKNTNPMLQIEPNKINTKDLHQYLLSIVGPRPIALASTIDIHNNNNLSPFSFFNIFSANPPIAIFSPARRVRNNTEKDTLKNIKQIKEVVINIVNYQLVEKASISSGEYEPEIDEFIKAGLTPIASEKIKPFRVKESPVQMECKVNQILELGKNGGAGNLIICEIVLIHINKNILNKENGIDQNKIKLVGRMGGSWYSKGFDEALFKIQKPDKNCGIGLDKIPNKIKNNPIFNESEICKLATINKLPGKHEIQLFKKSTETIEIDKIKNKNKREKKIQLKVKECLEKGNIEEAWKYLLY